MLVMLVILEIHEVFVIAVLSVARCVFHAPLLHTTHTSILRLLLLSRNLEVKMDMKLSAVGG